MYYKRRKFQKKFNWNKIYQFRPPLIVNCIFSIIFSISSLVSILQRWERTVPSLFIYILYVLAAIFLFTSIWSIVLLFKTSPPLQLVSRVANRNILFSKLLDDDIFRIISIGYNSLVINILFVITKIIAGWWFSSEWLIVLAMYYLILCVTKFLILRNTSYKNTQSEVQLQEKREWKVYRLCGYLPVLLSFVLQGVAIMIVKERKEFYYQGCLIFVVAFYDFYCLTTSNIYIIKKEKSTHHQ